MSLAAAARGSAVVGGGHERRGRNLKWGRERTASRQVLTGSTSRGMCVRSRASTLVARVVPKANSEGIVVPLDYYKILGVTRMSSPDAVQRGYRAAIENPIDAGYSDQALRLREAILTEACQVLSSRELKATYDAAYQMGRAGDIDVSLDQLPGALVLLHEVGELEVVMELGDTLLKENVLPSLTPDVAITVALAHCDIASRVMSGSGASVEDAYEELEAAIATLVKYRAPNEQLKKDIAEALLSMAPDYATTMLSRPIEDTASRARGLRVLKRLAWGPNLAPGVPIVPRERAQVVGPLQGSLTAAEVLDLYSAAPKTSLGLEDKYDVALALLAQALVDAKPPVLNRAADLLGAVATADLDRGRRDTVIVELAVAELLRGAPEASLAWLGFAEAQTSQQRQVLLRAGMDASIREFVRENSPGTDYLTGACTLVERWVNETLVSGFPELKGATFTLADWFDDPNVAQELQAMQRARNLGLTQIASAASDAIGMTTDAVAGVRKAISSAISRMSKPGTRPAGTDAKPTALPKSASLRQRITGVLSPAPAEPSAPARPGDGVLSREGADAQLRGYVRGTRLEGVALRGAVFALLTAGGYMVAAKQGLVPRIGPMPGHVHTVTPGIPGGPSAVVVRDTTVPAAPFKRSPAPQQEYTPATGKMTAAVAEQVVRHWQQIKALALGGTHEVHRLADVLDGRMLQQWKARAEDVRTQGWHWEYRVGKVVVDSVEVSLDGDRAIVEATLDESAQLVENNQALDAYKSTYTAQYQMMRKGGQWKIVGGKVIYR